ncbi:MAG: aminopeptidase P family protein [Candidatus Bathyarchaeota archaeon]|nr:aminopeptidase P family protein [Candidatus Bathyarchaeota archaeon]
MRRTDKFWHLAAEQSKPETFAVFNPVNIIYFTGFSGATALLLTPEGEGVLYVSGTNYQQAKAEVKGYTVELIKRGEQVMQKIAQQPRMGKLAVDTLSIEGWRQLAKEVGGEEHLESVFQVFRQLREVKDAEEIGLICGACRMADAGIKAASEIIRPGVTQKQIAAEAEYAMRKAGSDGVAFETIVSAGECCAFPHGTSHDKVVCEGDFVTVDLGATNQFYRSDITRTFIAGKATEKQRKIYQAVQLAHQRGYEKIASGVLAQKVDWAAWRVIERAGYGDYFVHNLGHGVGLEVHEAPVLGPESKDVLQAGNVVTDEPGIYLPGYGGVRIEDTVLVTKSGAQKLTTAPYMQL